MKSRVRGVLAAGVSLVAIAAVGTVWATSSAAAQSRYVTAVAATGDVSQSFWATGTITRQNLVEAGFGVSGTVRSLKVGVGDPVTAGDVLATLDTAALKLTLLNAQTDLASAKANRYAAEHPSSSSGSRASGGTGAPSAGGSSAGAGSGGASSGSGTGGGSVPSGITATDAATLYEAIAAVNVATLKWSNPDQPTTCDAIYTALLNANEQAVTDPGDGDQTTPGTGGDDSAGSSDDAGDSGDAGDAGNSGDTGDTGDSGDAGDTGGSADTGEDTGSEDVGESPGETAASSDTSESEPANTADGADDTEQLALVLDDLTLDDIKECGQAREDLLLAHAVLADYYQQLITTGTIAGDDEPADNSPATPGNSGSTPSRGGSSGGSSSSSSSATVSARAVAAAEADVLRAQQAVDTAETALASAELVAPITGTVGAISLTAGESSSGGSVTIVGEGTALVSIEVPLATRTLLSQGMAATVTPAGATDSVDATVAGISILETSGTAGDNPTYTTTIAVDDPDLALKEGAKAGVEIVTGTASGVVTVPASAVTPTGSGTGTVQVVESSSSDTAQTVTVATGAVGAGRVEITDGLDEGQIVVLSDRTATIDSLTTTSSSSSGRRTAGFGLPR